MSPCMSWKPRVWMSWVMSVIRWLNSWDPVAREPLSYLLREEQLLTYWQEGWGFGSVFRCSKLKQNVAAKLTKPQVSYMCISINVNIITKFIAVHESLLFSWMAFKFPLSLFLRHIVFSSFLFFIFYKRMHTFSLNIQMCSWGHAEIEIKFLVCIHKLDD